MSSNFSIAFRRFSFLDFLDKTYQMIKNTIYCSVTRFAWQISVWLYTNRQLKMWFSLKNLLLLRAGALRSTHCGVARGASIKSVPQELWDWKIVFLKPQAKHEFPNNDQQQSCQNQVHGIPRIRYQATAGDAERPHPRRLQKNNSDAWSQTYVVCDECWHENFVVCRKKTKSNQLEVVLFVRWQLIPKNQHQWFSSGKLTLQNWNAKLRVTVFNLGIVPGLFHAQQKWKPQGCSPRIRQEKRFSSLRIPSDKKYYLRNTCKNLD